MSESNEHRQLVANTAGVIGKYYPETRIRTDVQDSPGDPIPPIINGFRPDVFGVNQCEAAKFSHTIAEVKTVDDIARRHSEDQIAGFIEYLEKHNRGLFVLAVPGSGAGMAKSVLRFTYMSGIVANTKLVVFDSLDIWYFDSEIGKWHLG